MKRLFLSVILTILCPLIVYGQPITPGGGGTFAGGSVSNPVLAPDGTASSPAYSFSSEPTTGFYWASSQFRISVGGLAMLRIDNAGNFILQRPDAVFYFRDGATGISSPATGAVLMPSIYNNAEYNNGTCTTAKTIDPVNGNSQKVTLTNAQTCALTFTQPASGTAKILLKIIQSAAGSFNGAISGGKWPSAVVPTITQTTGAVDIISIYLDGTNAYCVASQDFR